MRETNSERSSCMVKIVLRVLPRTAGPTATAGPAAKAAKAAGTAAKAATTPAATTKASASTPTAKASHRSDPPAAAPSSARGAAEHAQEHHDQENTEGQSPPGKRLIRFLSRDWDRRARQLDVAVGGDEIGGSTRPKIDGGAVIVLPQQRYHLATDVPGARVVDDQLQAVADFEAIAVLARRNQQQHAPIVFATNAEVFKEFDRVVFDGPAIERADGHDGDLRSRLGFDFGGERFEALNGVGRDDACQIGDIAGGLDGRDGIGNGQRSPKEQNDCQCQADLLMRTAHAMPGSL